MAVCPNKNSKEWLYLVEQLGNENAWAVYTKLNDYVPTIEETNALKRNHSINEFNNHNVWAIDQAEDLIEKWVIGEDNRKHRVYKRFSYDKAKELAVQLKNKYPLADFKLVKVYTDKHNNYRVRPSVNWKLDHIQKALRIESPASINFVLKVINGLQNLQRNTFYTNKLQGWINDLQKQGVPKEQIEFFKESAKDGMTKEEIISSIAANYSYTVESNIAKSRGRIENEVGFDAMQDFLGEEYTGSQEENSQYYSNLTVPGGTNYTENEIYTPDITPSIKGHAQFSTDQGIGWFRSDDQRSKEFKEDIDQFQRAFGLDKDTRKATKNRRILEIQSDLFQKGRNKEKLAKSADEAFYDEAGYSGFKTGELLEEDLKFDSQKNQFLQLLNKDNNWVTFFIKSIIQDSAKKGYEKVLFPKGETAAKVEGHEALADEIINIDKQLKILKKEREKEGTKGRYIVIPNEYLDTGYRERNNKWYQETEGDINLTRSYTLEEVREVTDAPIEESFTKFDQQIVSLESRRKELKAEGIEKLKPIEAFYEIKVGNILKKNFTTKIITDEYNNQWYEVEITPDLKQKIKVIQLQLNKEGKGSKLGIDRLHELGLKKGMSYIDSKTLLENLSKNNSLPESIKPLLNPLLEAINQNNVNIYPAYFTDERSDVFMGYDIKNNVIYVNLSNDRQINEEHFDISLLHEIVHALTTNSIERVAINGTFTKKEQVFHDTIAKLRLNIKELYYKKYGKSNVDAALNRLVNNEYTHEDIRFYPLSDESEFISGLLTNKEFLSEVQELESNKNIIQRIIDAIRRLFNIPISSKDSINYILDFTKQFEFSKIEYTDKIQRAIDPFSEEELKANKQRRINAEMAAKKLNDLQQLKKQALDVLKRKQNIYISRGKPANAEEAQALQTLIEESEDLQGVLYFVQDAHKRIRGLYNLYEQTELKQAETDEPLYTAQMLYKWKDSVSAYEMLEEIRELINKANWRPLVADRIANNKDLQTVIQSLDSTILLKNELINLYKRKGKEIVTKFLAPHVTRMEGEFRRELQKEYRELKKEGKTTQTLDEFITDNLGNEAATIRERTKMFIEQELERASKDVGKITSYIDNVLDSPDPVIAAMVKAFATQMAKARRETLKIERHLVDLVREMEVQYGNNITTDPYTFYEWMLEKDEFGNPTGHYITQYKSQLWEEYRRLGNDLKKHDDKTRKIIRKAWLKKNAPLDYEEFNSAKRNEILRLVQEGKLTTAEADKLFDIDADIFAERQPLNQIVNIVGAEELNDWIYKNIWNYRTPVKDGAIYKELKKDGTIVWEGKEVNWHNDQWLKLDEFMKRNPNDSKTKFYNTIVNISKSADKKLPYYNRLGTRLPGITKDLSERIKAGQKPSDIFKESLRKGLKVIGDESDRGTLQMTNEAGEPVSFLPIYYTNQVDIKNQSFDIATLYHRFADMANNFVYAHEILPEMEMAKFFVADRKVIKTDSQGNPIINAFFKKERTPHEIEGIKSNLYKQLESWFESIVYGKRVEDEGEWNIFGLKIDKAKVTDLLQKYTSLNLLGLNFVQGTANVLLGEAMQRIETVAKEYVSSKSYKKARHVYDKNLMGILGDIGNRKPTNLVSLLLEEFDILNEYENSKFRKNSKFRQLMSQDTLFFTAKAGEHFVQSRFLLAMLEELRAKDIDGNDLGSMLDNISVENNELKVNDKVVNFGEKERIQFEYKVRGILSRLHGEYSDLGRVAIQRASLGRMAYQFRKFIVPGFKRRWGKMAYNERLEDFVEGNYLAAGRFIKNLFKDGRWYEFHIMKNWENLTQAEKANIHRTFGEVGFLTAAIILSRVFLSLHADLDDDDEWLWEFGAYQMLRFKTELMFFINPEAAMDILRSPAASMSMIENTFKLINQVMTGPFEVYEKGPWKDRLKMSKIVTDFIPAYKQYYRLRDIQQNINWFK